MRWKFDQVSDTRTHEEILVTIHAIVYREHRSDLLSSLCIAKPTQRNSSEKNEGSTESTFLFPHDHGVDLLFRILTAMFGIRDSFGVTTSPSPA
jgi:hypothetical protein